MDELLQRQQEASEMQSQIRTMFDQFGRNMLRKFMLVAEVNNAVVG